MDRIRQSVTRKDHRVKLCGEAMYADDIKMQGMLHGRLLWSQKPCARIREIRLPVLPTGYYSVDHADVPGKNRVAIVEDDTPVFADGRVNYAGEPILMIVGPDRSVVSRLIAETEVLYDEETPVLDMEASETVFYHYQYGKGDVDRAFSEADEVIEETFYTGRQEQAYLEPQGMIAWSKEGKTTVVGSLQCPYYVLGALRTALGCSDEEARVISAETGGGFGGKEDYPSHLACMAAVAARKCGRPVKVVFDRREDMRSTSKRHPARMIYRTAVKDGAVTAMDIDVLFDSGAYTTLSPVVLQRGVVAACGVYRIDNLRVRGRAVKTNTVPNGAFRGFGAPQTFFAVEMHMGHIAGRLGQEPLAFKERHLSRQGDATGTGGTFHFPILLPEMIARAKEMSGYEEKRGRYAAAQTGRFRRGIACALAFHGCGFTGSGERDHIRAVARLAKLEDDTVEVLVSNTDIGQGLETSFCKIAAQVLELPLDRVIISNPDTDHVPDSGPTVASRSVMVVGKLIERAARRLKEDWRPGEYQVVEEHYVQPEYVRTFDLETFSGDAYPTYSWSVNVTELELDALTGESRVLGAWGVYDVGAPIDENILRGQMEGGLVQGIGYASMEQMDAKDGRIRNDSFSDYLIPTAADVPVLAVDFVDNPYEDGPFGAKGAGELPLDGVAPSYLAAAEQAVGKELCRIPFRMEDALDGLEGTEV